MTNTEFISNNAIGSGGGGFIAEATLTSSHFEQNTSGAIGGGLVVTDALTATNTSFINNIAASHGGGVFTTIATVIAGRFERNTARGGKGGGLIAFGTLTLTGTHFIRNTANVGGGVYQDYPIFYEPPDGQIINALFASNIATSTGAALYLASLGSVEILHTTIADVNLNPTGAIAVLSSTVGLTNTIIASHTVGISQTAGTVSEDYNLFFNVPTTSTGVVAHGGNSLTGDPRFVDPANDDYHLQAGSAALNAALPAWLTLTLRVTHVHLVLVQILVLTNGLLPQQH